MDVCAKERKKIIFRTGFDKKMKTGLMYTKVYMIKLLAEDDGTLF